jgi:hypothetical protein
VFCGWSKSAVSYEVYNKACYSATTPSVKSVTASSTPTPRASGVPLVYSDSDRYRLNPFSFLFSAGQRYQRPQRGGALEAKALKEAPGALVGRVDGGQQRRQAQRGERQIDHAGEGLSHQALAPVAAGEQAPNLGRRPVRREAVDAAGADDPLFLGVDDAPLQRLALAKQAVHTAQHLGDQARVGKGWVAGELHDLGIAVDREDVGAVGGG